MLLAIELDALLRCSAAMIMAHYCGHSCFNIRCTILLAAPQPEPRQPLLSGAQVCVMGRDAGDHDEADL